MEQAPTLRKPLPAIGSLGERRGPWMAEIPAGGLDRLQTARSDCSSRSAQPAPVAIRAGSYAMRRRQPVNAQPWESPAVQQFAASLREAGGNSSGGRPAAMILEGRQGTVLQAVGEIEDHKVAGKVVADIQREAQANAMTQAAAPGHTAQGTSLVRVEAGQRAPLQRGKVAFGAVYEHRDFAGKPKIVSSTALLPEQQFQLDYQSHSNVRQLARQRGDAPSGSAALVWVGVGSGPVGEAQMARVRQAVVDARAERLSLEKLSSEKPYSRHT